jgi:diadenosine tetraphosphate (Ap4A) HIT family hydrolase
MSQACELCTLAGGEVLHADELLRVVLVDDGQYPGFCRVIWNAHVKEMTDLVPAERSRLMMSVMKVEAALRETMSPDKINLASLGNMTPHLHWHVIPRFAGDAHFPAPVWATAQREPDAAALAARASRLQALRAAIARQFREFAPDPSSATAKEP